MKLFFVASPPTAEGDFAYTVTLFDPENANTEESTVAAFAEDWPNSIYFVLDILP